jgi:hypothetical protein
MLHGCDNKTLAMERAPQGVDRAFIPLNAGEDGDAGHQGPHVDEDGLRERAAVHSSSVTVR